MPADRPFQISLRFCFGLTTCAAAMCAIAFRAPLLFAKLIGVFLCFWPLFVLAGVGIARIYSSRDRP